MTLNVALYMIHVEVNTCDSFFFYKNNYDRNFKRYGPLNYYYKIMICYLLVFKIFETRLYQYFVVIELVSTMFSSAFRAK